MKAILKVETITKKDGTKDKVTHYDDGTQSTKTEIGLYAIYSGGLTSDSRPFCEERNGKVYTRAEIETWRDLEWEQKPQNYNPFKDLGGDGCRHKLDWISKQLAEILRPDLKD